MKKLIITIAASVAAVLAQPGVTVNQDGAIRTQIGTEQRAVIIQGGGTVSTAPSLSLYNGGYSLFCAGLEAGGTCSFYRKVNGESREWLRISADGIQLIGDQGILQPLNGKPRPGCSVLYREGLAFEDCP